MATLMVLPLTGCGIFFSPSHHYRYVLQVDVQTPQGSVTGQSILDVEAYEDSGLNGGSVHSKIRGEAVTINLPNGIKLFALLRGVDGLTGAFASAAYSRVLPSNVMLNSDWRVPFDTIGSQRAAGEVDPDHYPEMVYFRQIGDPTSIMSAVQSEKKNLVWDGYSIKAVKVSITTTEKGGTVEATIPWIKGLDKNQAIMPGHALNDYSLAARIVAGDFIRK